MQSVRDIVLFLKQGFSAGSEKYSDAVLLLAHVLQTSKEKIIAFDERQLSQQQLISFKDYVARLRKGEPVAYIIGHKEFWSLDLVVNDNCLIPRPETEALVEWILSRFESNLQLDVLDLGTGSGAIACAIASERECWNITATDNSKSALQVAEHNAERLNLKNVKFACGDFFAPVANKKFNIIVSNPPYVAEDDRHLTALSFEPATALVASNSGYADLIAIINSAQDYLYNNGCLVLEHGYQQAEHLVCALNDRGYNNISSHQDLAGNPRFVTAYKGN